MEFLIISIVKFLAVSIIFLVVISALNRKREPKEYREIRKALDEERRPK